MALFISVQSDQVRTDELMESLHESFVLEFASQIDEMPCREAIIADILRACISTSDTLIELSIRESWKKLDEDGDRTLDAFIENISNTAIKDFVLAELSDCGLDTENFDDDENKVVNQASSAIAKWFVSLIPNTSWQKMNRDDFQYEIMDNILSVTYQTLTDQLRDGFKSYILSPPL